MGFYRQDPSMALKLKDLIKRFEQEGRDDLSNNIAITWIKYNDSKPIPFNGIGAGWRNTCQIYPASIVKFIYGIAVETWIKKGLIIDSQELQRAMHEMLANSSNDATSYIVDMLTGTNSGPNLYANNWNNWVKQREIINNWLKTLDLNELNGINCCQKTWEDGPYGRDKQFYGINDQNRNSLSTDATAVLLEGLMTDYLLGENASNRIRKSMYRSLDIIQRKKDYENQIDGFLGGGLPLDASLWSKAGLMSKVRHDATWWHNYGNENPNLLIVFSEGKELSNDSFLLPAIASELNEFEIKI